MGGGASKKKLDEQKYELLKTTPFFTFLRSDEAIRQCSEFFELVKIKEGEQLTAAAFIVVVDGELALSTLVPHNNAGKKQNVSELLAVKKKGDFFSKAGKELVADRLKEGVSMEKVVNAFDFTTVRAMKDTTILKLDGRAKASYLEKHADAAVSIEKILNTDIKHMLKPIPFLANIDKQRLTSLAELFTYETFNPGDVVLKEGETDDQFYLVLQGSLSVTAKINHQEQTLSVFQVLEEEEEKSDDDNGAIKEEEEEDDDDQDDQDGKDGGDSARSVPAEAAPQAAAAQAEEEPATSNSSPADGGAPVKLLDVGSGGEHRASVSLFTEPKKRKPKRSSENVPVLRPQPSIRLLRKGSSLVNESINTLNLAEVGTGSYFGEMGMMVNMPRSATVTATERCLLAKMKGHEFHNFLKLSPEVQKTLDQDARERMVRKLYAFRLPFFAGISKDKLLELSHLSELQQHPPGTVLMEEGQNCRTFFIVIHGIVNVVKGGETIIRLAQGAYFGEISMITGKPHLATVAAHSDVVLLAVTKESFDVFFKGSEELLAEFEMRVLGEKEITLKHLLKHTLGRELFRQHLENEFTVEHLNFWEQVQLYRLGKAKREDIISEYIGGNSKTPVNVKDALWERCINAPPERYETMFDECEQEVFALMNRDNFSRFKKTELFRELINAICCYTNEDLLIDHADLRRAEMSFGRVSAERKEKAKEKQKVAADSKDENA